MTQEQKTAAMQRARFNAREQAGAHRGAVHHAGPRGRERQGRRRQVVGHREPRRRARRARAHVGVLDADIWGFSVPRMLGVEGRLGGSDGKIEPNVAAPVGDGTLKVVSMGFLVDDESTALMWRGLILTKALEQFLTDVRWGDLDYLLIDMPPGTGDVQMGLARMLPQAEMLVVTTPARAAQKVATRVADMARRSYMKVVGVVENMSEFVAPDGSPSRAVRRGRRRRARRGDRRAARGARSRSSPRCRPVATPAPGRARRRPTAPPAPRSTSSRRASSTSCSRRSRWRAAPPASSTSSARSSPDARDEPGPEPGLVDCGRAIVS